MSYYEAHADDFHREKPFPFWWHIKKYFAQEPSVLDLGCGTGRLIDLANIEPDKYLGIDNAGGMLHVAKRTHQQHAFLQKDVTQSMFLDKEFDVVALLAVLHHFNEPKHWQKILRNITEHMHKNSVAIITCWIVNKENLPDKATVTTRPDGFKEATLPTGTTNRYYFGFTKELLLQTTAPFFETINCDYIDNQQVNQEHPQNLVFIGKLI